MSGMCTMQGLDLTSAGHHTVPANSTTGTHFLEEGKQKIAMLTLTQMLFVGVVLKFIKKQFTILCFVENNHLKMIHNFVIL